VTGLREQLRAEVIESEEKVADVAAQLKAYFAGERRAFDVPIDLSLASAFQRRVLMAARGVPAGQVVTYGELARRIGVPNASRAVGWALGRNPVPIVIPCHRIVRTGGGLGGYIGGVKVKRRLLELEGARV
jgi:methylated-DNA-[protein]-cysteine S-methyltransferase